MVGYETVEELFRDLSKKDLDFAFLPILKEGEWNKKNAKLMRSAGCFLVKKFTFAMDWEFGLFAKEFAVYPGANMGIFFLVLDPEKTDVFSYLSTLSAFGFSVQTLHTFEEKNRLFGFLEFSFSAFESDAFRVFDFLDLSAEEFLFRGLYSNEQK